MNHDFVFNPAASPAPSPAHTLRLRVRYNECDPMGVAHHAAYAPWLEIGRTELLRQTGISYAQLEQQGCFLVIVRLAINYKRPVRYDDIVEVRTTRQGGGRVKIEHTYELWVVEQAAHPLGSIQTKPPAPASNDQPSFTPYLAATAQTTLGSVDKTGKIQALPQYSAS